jgi:hypothetical protein
LLALKLGGGGVCESHAKLIGIFFSCLKCKNCRKFLFLLPYKVKKTLLKKIVKKVPE